MRITAAHLTCLAALAAPVIAHANCYSVYDGQNRLAFQTTVSPIDLSRPISDAMRARFPGGFLVMVPDDSNCGEFRAGSVLQPRFDAVGLTRASAVPASQALEASPLLRGTRSTAGYDDTPADTSDLASREAARSGNALNIKRQSRP